MSENLTLTYSREDDDYPNLWLIIPMEEYLENQLEMMRLTPELLLRIQEQATGFKITEHLKKMYQEKWTVVEKILDKEGMAALEQLDPATWNQLMRVVNDPLTLEPMELLDVEEDLGPMSERELDRALDAIEYLDNLRMKEPEPWDFTPMGP